MVHKVEQKEKVRPYSEGRTFVIFFEQRLLVLFQKGIYQVCWDNIFLEGVSSCLFVFDCANYFSQCLGLTSIAVSCNCFLCHDELGLLDFLVNGVLLQNWVVLFQLHS